MVAGVVGRITWGVVKRKGALQVPRLPPDFLSGLVASLNLMRLSSKKAAYVVVLENSIVGNPEFARDDKGEVCSFRHSCDLDGMNCSLRAWRTVLSATNRFPLGRPPYICHPDRSAAERGDLLCALPPNHVPGKP